MFPPPPSSRECVFLILQQPHHDQRASTLNSDPVGGDCDAAAYLNERAELRDVVEQQEVSSVVFQVGVLA